MPRVLRILNRFNLGGPTYNAAYLTRYLAPEFETCLIGGHADPDEQSSTSIAESIGVPFEQVPGMYRSLNWRNDRMAYQWIRQKIEEFKPDIVHTHAAKAGALGRMAAAKCGVPAIVHTYHGHVFSGYFSPLKTHVYKVAERRLARQSHAIVAISPEQKHDLVSIYRICSEEQTHVVRLGFDLERFQQGHEEKRRAFRREFGLEEDTLVISIVGRLTAIKNHELFLHAFSKLRSLTRKPIVGLIVGGGELDDELQEITSLLAMEYSPATQRGILFAGWRHDIDHVMAASDIVALTSHNEGTPVSLIEAQASGVPVISTGVGGVEDVIQRDRTGIICQPNDASAFAYGLLRLIENPGLRADYGRNAAQHATRYHYSRLVSDMSELYNSLLKK
ncbi:MAG: glycosyltransferase [Flavobacteriales bacterium]|nr:glycosyltransferase [Flavobacteriales bacterium]